jgi:hypothetical protein
MEQEYRVWVQGLQAVVSQRVIMFVSLQLGRQQKRVFPEKLANGWMEKYWDIICGVSFLLTPSLPDSLRNLLSNYPRTSVSPANSSHHCSTFINHPVIQHCTFSMLTASLNKQLNKLQHFYLVFIHCTSYLEVTWEKEEMEHPFRRW